MKELLILTGKINRKNKALVKYLDQRLPGRTKVSLGLFEDLVFEIDGKKIMVRLGQRKITDFDLIVFRGVGKDFLTLAGNLALCLEYLRIDYTDTVFKQIGPFGSKLTSLIKLSLAGLPTMSSYYCQQHYIREHLGEIVSRYGFPMIAKDLTLQGGKGVFLVKHENDFDFLNEAKPEQQFLFQDFYPESEEYRLLVLDYKPEVYYQKIRTDPNEFRANTVLGAEERYFAPDQASDEMKRLAVKAAKVLGYEIAGVDFLVEKKTGKLWILEVNRGPGLTYDTQVSPELPTVAAFLAKKMGGR